MVSVRDGAAVLFWLGAAGVLYPYVGYPLLLWAWARVRPRPDGSGLGGELPSVSMIVPVHNEAARLERKIENTERLVYPKDRLEVIFISDGSTDGTIELLQRRMGPGMRVIDLPTRGGKAAGLNAGLAAARHDILVFTDAAIELEPGAVERLVRRFAQPEIGCVSGEDRIADAGGEGLYGRYELLLRRLETQVHSIVGASGSFYAQRRAICRPFTEGMAPDFLSVLRTVRGRLSGHQRRGRGRHDDQPVRSAPRVRSQGADADPRHDDAVRPRAGCSARATGCSPSRCGRTRSCAGWRRCSSR